jgi:hypothetical protein
MTASMKRAPFLPGVALFVFFLSTGSLFFPTQIFSDSYINCFQVEKALQAPGTYYAAFMNPLGHVLQNRFYYSIGRLLEFFGYHGRLLYALQFTSLVFSALAVLLMYLTLLHLFRKPWSAFLSAALMGFGYSFWFWSGQAKSYSIATFFLLLAFFLFVRFPSMPGVALASICSASASGFFQGALPFAGIMLLYILLCRKPLKERLALAGLYVLLTSAFIFIMYILASGSLGYISVFSRDGICEAGKIFWRALSNGQIPGTIPYNSTVYRHSLSEHIFLLLYNMAAESFIPMGQMMFFGFQTMFERSGFVTGINTALNFIILSGIAVILAVFLFKTRKTRPEDSRFLILALAWLLFFGSAFFLIDATHVYLYVCSLGFIIFMGCVSASSGTARIVLLAMVLILFGANFYQMKSGNCRDRSLAEIGRIKTGARMGDYFVFGSVNGCSFGPAWSVTYYFLADMIFLEDNESGQFDSGLFPPGLSDRIRRALARGGHVFINRTGFLSCFPPGKRDIAWKAWESEFGLDFSFSATDFHHTPLPAADDYYRVLDKGGGADSLNDPE